MQRLGAPGLSISTAPSMGTYSQPMSLAASAGKAACRSGVVVKKALARSSWCIPLASSIADTSSTVALCISSRVSALATVAPRTPRQATCLLFSAASISLLFRVNKKSVGSCHALLLLPGYLVIALRELQGCVAAAGWYSVIPPVVKAAVGPGLPHIETQAARAE